MSGVFPGSRTAQFERIRLRPLQKPGDELHWARLLWYDEPRACVLYLQARAGQDEAPLLRLQVVDPNTLIAELRTALGEAGYGLEACATCQHWRPAADFDKDQLPHGHCAWRQDGASILPALNMITAQSGFALSCRHWRAAVEVQPASDVQHADESPKRAAVEKKAQERAARSLRGRLKQLLSAKSKDDAPPASTLDMRLIEQSGVGAGTEPCLACQGRIANLGAQRSHTAEGDQQAYSVWRCRRCHTLYLNHWIDRWVRLDTLETVESYFRITPAEAIMLLIDIEQQADDTNFKTTVNACRSLSKQVKQGR